MQPVQPISVAHLPSLLAALAEAARAGPRTAERFVPPRIGILEETAARRHQFVLGRRGVGKSTLLRKIESLGDEAERVVVFVDVETLRDRPYPDVLIEMLIVLLMGMRDRLKPDDWYRLDQRVARLRVRMRLAALTTMLRRLLAQPQIAQRTVRDLQSRGSGLSLAAHRPRPRRFDGAQALPTPPLARAEVRDVRLPAASEHRAFSTVEPIEIYRWWDHAAERGGSAAIPRSLCAPWGIASAGGRMRPGSRGSWRGATRRAGRFSGRHHGGPDAPVARLPSREDLDDRGCHAACARRSAPAERLIPDLGAATGRQQWTAIDCARSHRRRERDARGAGAPTQTDVHDARQGVR